MDQKINYVQKNQKTINVTRCPKFFDELYTKKNVILEMEPSLIAPILRKLSVWFITNDTIQFYYCFMSFRKSTNKKTFFLWQLAKIFVHS